MTFDPTTNRIQTELLKPEEREALENWPHGLVYHSCGEWVDHSANGELYYNLVYRGKPAPETVSRWAGWRRLTGNTTATYIRRWGVTDDEPHLKQHIEYIYDTNTGELLEVKIHPAQGGENG